MICLLQIMEMLSIELIYDSLLISAPRNALALHGLMFCLRQCRRVVQKMALLLIDKRY